MTPLRPSRRHRRNTAGFTLPEMMIGMTIGSMLLAGVLTTYIYLMKGFQAVANYREIHAGGRKAVDIFAKDVRAVSAITTFNSGSLTVSIPTNFTSSGTVLGTKTVTYVYRNSALYRTDSSTGNTDMLATNIYSLTWMLYDHIGSNTTLTSTAKGISIDVKLRKFVISQIQSEDYLSARLDMRNKP